MSSKNYVFTINNPERDANGVPVPLLFDEGNMLYMVYQLERGEQGTEHFQGYVEFRTRRTLAAAKRLLGQERAHLERRRGTRNQAIDYCKKEESRVSGPWEHGQSSSRQGRRTDIDEFKSWFDERVRTREECIDEFPGVYARYPRFVSELLERRRVSSLQTQVFTPRDGWQRRLDEDLRGPVDRRKVYWVYGRTGGEGKSYFALNWRKDGSDTFIVTGGRFADIFYGFMCAGCPGVIFFDWARDSEEAFPYKVLENFKNGFFLNTKYETKQVRFDSPHLVVFSNFAPNMEKLSLDRWDIREI